MKRYLSVALAALVLTGCITRPPVEPTTPPVTIEPVTPPVIETPPCRHCATATQDAAVD